MFLGQDYLTSNPEIVQKSLDHYKEKLEDFLNDDEIPMQPKLVREEIPKIRERITKIQEILSGGNLNEIYTLQNEMDFLKTALRCYNNDLGKSISELNKRFYDEFSTDNEILREKKAVLEAFERLSKL